MFTDIRTESDKRIVEIRECIHFIASQIPASDVGKIVKTNDLHISFSDVSGFCTHVITTFEDYIVSKEFLK